MFSEFLSAAQPLLDKFNPQEVFSSITNFLGSGYAGMAVMALLFLGAWNKLRKLMAIGAVAAIIWLLCSTGILNLDGVFNMFGA